MNEALLWIYLAVGFAASVSICIYAIRHDGGDPIWVVVSLMALVVWPILAIGIVAIALWDNRRSARLARSRQGGDGRLKTR